MFCKNQQVGARTKHIDVKYHFVRELINTNRLQVKFVRTENNPADIFTKHVTEQIFSKMSLEMRLGQIGCWREDDKNDDILTVGVTVTLHDILIVSDLEVV